jgi:hypothetical protein
MYYLRTKTEGNALEGKGRHQSYSSQVRKKKPTDREKLDKPAARFVDGVVNRKCFFHEADKVIVITRDLPAIGNVQYHCACVPVSIQLLSAVI